VAGPDMETRKNLAKQGKAIPDSKGSGGRYPIRDKGDLAKAIQAVGRAAGGEEGRKKVRRFCMKRARALGLTNMIPDAWLPDGSLKSS
jgi:hypothetical protein